LLISLVLTAESGNFFGALIAMLPAKEHHDEKP
jgi:hypothetical protein